MYNSEIPEYPIFQARPKYSVKLFSIVVCMVQETTRRNPRKDHLGRFLGEGGGRGHALRLSHIMECECGRYFLIQFLYRIV